MKTSLPSSVLAEFLARAPRTVQEERAAGRQPVHTVYGGAHLFRADTAAKLGAVARRCLQTYAPTSSDLATVLGLTSPGDIADAVHRRITDKLTSEPIEDYRIDFEDGYGHRSDDEEDAHAAGCAAEIARGMTDGALPPFIGFRVKSFEPETRRRSLRTMDILLTGLAQQTGGRVPENFVVTLPKVGEPEAVASFAEALAMLEERCGFGRHSIGIEIMVETPRAIIGADGGCALPRLIGAAGDRCVAAHFGAYDYTAACDITASCQSLDHEACHFARQMMQTSLAGRGIRLSDGATTLLPVEPHRPAEDGSELNEKQRLENRHAVHRAWRLSYEDIRRSLAAGFYQGWDLHPAQVPIRYAATYAFFLEGLGEASARLKQFIERAAQATRVGNVFDDAATGQGLLNYFLRALNCGAIRRTDLQHAGLTLEDLRSRSFLTIVGRRHAGGQ